MAKLGFFLFVSHVNEDRTVAREIVDELERRGVPCWIAPRDVEPGEPFDDEIADALDRCRAMLLIFSERCNDSEYIRREILIASPCMSRTINSTATKRVRSPIDGRPSNLLARYSANVSARSVSAAGSIEMGDRDGTCRSPSEQSN